MMNAATCRFIGIKSQLNNSIGKVGDIAYVSDLKEIYAKLGGNSWTKICSYEEAFEPKEEANNRPKICTQCGAPLKKYSHRCEYCDTEY